MGRKRKNERSDRDENGFEKPGLSRNVHDRQEPILTIDESRGESLFAVIDFTLPSSPIVRRVMAKRRTAGNLDVVMYWGVVGPDGFCLKKLDIMRKPNETEKGFWKFVGAVETTYRSHGGSTHIKSFDGKNINQAADLLEKTGSGKVWRPKPGAPVDFSNSSEG